jgi:hypothetical protein
VAEGHLAVSANGLDFANRHGRITVCLGFRRRRRIGLSWCHGDIFRNIFIEVGGSDIPGGNLFAWLELLIGLVKKVREVLISNTGRYILGHLGYLIALLII